MDSAAKSLGGTRVSQAPSGAWAGSQMGHDEEFRKAKECLWASCVRNRAVTGRKETSGSWKRIQDQG